MGYIPLTTYLHTYKISDYVDVKVNDAVAGRVRAQVLLHHSHRRRGGQRGGAHVRFCFRRQTWMQHQDHGGGPRELQRGGGAPRGLRMERGLTTSRWTSAFRRPIDAPRGLHHGEAAHHLEVDFGGVVVGLDSDDGEVDFSVEAALDIDDVLGSGLRPYLEVQVVALTSGRLMMAGLDLGLEVFVIIENLFLVPANISG
jgi:hypothetical protein